MEMKVGKAFPLKKKLKKNCVKKRKGQTKKKKKKDSINSAKSLFASKRRDVKRNWEAGRGRGGGACKPFQQSSVSESTPIQYYLQIFVLVSISFPSATIVLFHQNPFPEAVQPCLAPIDQKAY